MVTIISILTLGAVVILAALVLALQRRVTDFKDAHQNDKSMVLINQNMQGMQQKLDKATDAINERLTNAAKVIMSVQKELGTVQERFKGFEEFNELLHPKLRGNIGEQILADMLAQVFSTDHYALQFKFKDGQTVDAIIRSNAGILPIDSKFPLENFKQMTRATADDERAAAKKEFAKAVKRHIDDIGRKYILPEEGTVNFAVMYVPSENVYYQMLTDDENDMLEYARTKNIVVTSPHGFFNFLRVVLMGLERGKLQEQAQKIWDILKGVQQETDRFGDTLGVLARHITNAKGAMDMVNTSYSKLTGKIDQVKLLE